MAYSSGNRNFIAEAASWLAAAAILVGGITHFSELKQLTGNALGLKLPTAQASTATADQAPAANAAPHQSSGGVVELRAGSHGHFETEAEINGRAIQVMVDTGATGVAMSYEDAEAAGIYVKDSDYTHQSRTANGIARIAMVNIDRISIGEITVRNVQGAVLEPGKLKGTLLGMSFLSRLSRVDMRQGTLLLQE